MIIDNLPTEFLQKSSITYPPTSNGKNFELYFYYRFLKEMPKLDFIYIPIQWTNYYIKNNYGHNIDLIKSYIQNAITKDKKYFTIIQFAGGTLVEIPNIIYFSMGGMFNTTIPSSSRFIKLPLVYETTKNNSSNFLKYKKNKKYLASYIGRPTNEIRIELENLYSSNDNFYIKNIDSDGFIEKKNIKQFKSLLNNSYFSICPRGYGPTSYRLYESISYGVVPVYISDEFFLPYEEILDWSEFSVLIKNKDIKNLENILREKITSGEYLILQKNLNKVKDKYFNYEYMFTYALNQLKSNKI